ncbi:hypothetical protein DSUL_100203 [Desulfovibrionales bacterium]
MHQLLSLHASVLDHSLRSVSATTHTFNIIVLSQNGHRYLRKKCKYAL